MRRRRNPIATSILTEAHATVPELVEPQATTWHRSLANAVRSGHALAERLGLDPSALGLSADAERDFPVLVPESYVARMRPGDPGDPLLRQVLAVHEETLDVPGFTSDPVGDTDARDQPGLLRKYAGRALLIATGACAVHCRYCFRRHYAYGDDPRTLDDWRPALKTIAADESIREVILSGGDPLTLVDHSLARLVHEIAAVPHVRRLRVHTRLPVVLPDRVTPALLDLFSSGGPTPVVVVHANHANELVADAATAVRRLVTAGVTTLNQAVLLRGVNDTFEAQRDLCERLVDLGVIPYYLHQLDRVAGAAHFETPESTGHAIVARLRTHLPGYAVPQYVREVRGEPNKVPLARPF